MTEKSQNNFEIPLKIILLYCFFLIEIIPIRFEVKSFEEYVESILQTIVYFVFSIL